MRIPTNRQPTHPGEMLREEFLIPMNLTQKELADSIKVPYQRINEIVSGKRGVTPSTALRLAKYFGMSADFWLSLQIKFDLYLAQKKERQVLERIRQMNNPTMQEAV
ncbi:MAG TPA: HigA family addiction module antitoxin [Pyrinomonadaceae bacterium]|jgi:addiction module HigA family antidote|nr:HigA family addiction module antitoxin [Pyrinomonadaceae bacterium]